MIKCYVRICVCTSIICACFFQYQNPRIGKSRGGDQDFFTKMKIYPNQKNPEKARFLPLKIPNSNYIYEFYRI
jgi:hypothetical protein